MAPAQTSWQYLDRKPGSQEKQLYVRGTKLSARVIYGLFLNEEDPQSPESIAADYNLPIEAVKEAIAYCDADPDEVAEDWEVEQAMVEASGQDQDDPRLWRNLTVNELLEVQSRARAGTYPLRVRYFRHRQP